MFSKIAIRSTPLAILFGIILVISMILHGLTKKCLNEGTNNQNDTFQFLSLSLSAFFILNSSENSCLKISSTFVVVCTIFYNEDTKKGPIPPPKKNKVLFKCFFFY
jgi:hypothetical protein